MALIFLKEVNMTGKSHVEAKDGRLFLSPERWVGLLFCHMPAEKWGDIGRDQLLEVLHTMQGILKREGPDGLMEQYRDEITAEMPAFGKKIEGADLTPFGVLYSIARGDKLFSPPPLSSRMPVPENEIIKLT